MIASLTSTDFKSKVAQIKADGQLKLLEICLVVSFFGMIGGFVYVWSNHERGGIIILASIFGIWRFLSWLRSRIARLASDLGVCCDGCGEPLVQFSSTSTVQPKFPVGMCSNCGSDTISDLAGSSANFTVMLERNSFSRGFYKSLGEETAKICLVAVKCFIGAMAAVAGLALATSVLLSFLRSLIQSIFNNG